MSHSTLFRVALGLNLLVAGCSGTSSDPEALRTALTQFETSSAKTADSLLALYEDTASLKTAIAASDTAKSDALFGTFAAKTATFETAVKDLEAAEKAIQASLAAGGGGAGLTSLEQHLEESKGFFASVRKFFDIGGKIREMNEAASKAREERDSALERQDIDAYQAAQKKMDAAGQVVITEMTVSVSTTLVAAPLKPVTAGGMLLKSAAKKAYQKGLIAITSTKECATDVKSPSCVVGVEKTDAAGQVRAPVGTNSVVVSGGGNARVRVDEVPVAASGPRKVVKRDPVPIATALPKDVTRGDEADDIEDEPAPVWIMCFTLVFSPELHRDDACISFGGTEEDWNALGNPAAQNAWCKEHGYQDAYADYPSEENCKKFCREMQTSVEVCKTP